MTSGGNEFNGFPDSQISEMWLSKRPWSHHLQNLGGTGSMGPKAVAPRLTTKKNGVSVRQICIINY